MILNRPAIIATALILLVGIIGYLMASNERAMEKCTETQSADVCAYILK